MNAPKKDDGEEASDGIYDETWGVSLGGFY